MHPPFRRTGLFYMAKAQNPRAAEKDFCRRRLRVRVTVGLTL